MATAQVTYTLEGQLAARAPVPDMLALQAGQQLARRLTMLGFVSAGGMGEVYNVFDSRVGTRLALKVVRRELSTRPLALELRQTDRMRGRLPRGGRHRKALATEYPLVSRAGPHSPSTEHGGRPETTESIQSFAGM